MSLPELDREGRINILEIWEFHLEKSQKHLAESFWDTIVIPYWDWCEHQHYLALTDGDTERSKFWELLPLSYDTFPKAVKRAIHRPPSSLGQVYSFLKRILKTDFATRYPDEFTALLIVLIQIDQYPYGNKDNWGKLWHSIKDSGAKKIGELRDELAKKKVIDE